MDLPRYADPVGFEHMTPVHVHAMYHTKQHRRPLDHHDQYNNIMSLTAGVQ